MFLDVRSVSHYHSLLHCPGKHTCVWQPAIREYNLLLDSGSGDLCGKKGDSFSYALFCRITWPLPFFRQHKTEALRVFSQGDFCCYTTNLRNSYLCIPRGLDEFMMQKKDYEFCHPVLASYILSLSYIASKKGFVIQHAEMAKPLGNGEKLPEGSALRSVPLGNSLSLMALPSFLQLLRNKC